MVIPDLTGGGAERVTANICKNLNRHLFNVSVCYLKEKDDTGEELENAGIDIIGLPKTKYLKNDYLSFLKIRNIVHQNKIDLIHSHLTEALIETSIFKLISPGVKLLHTFHFGNYPHLEKKYLILEKIFSRIPDKLIAVGNEQRKLIKKVFNISDSKITTVWNGVEVRSDIDTDLQRRFTQNKKIVMGSMSTLIEQKGIHYLLNAVSELKRRNDNFILIIVGEGPLRNELESKSKKMDLGDTVFFIGWLKNASSRILPVFDIFVQSSLWEAMSMVLLEAMAAGKPIVTTNVGENRHVIDDGENGFLVEPKNILAMADALERLIVSSELRCETGLKAKQKYEKYFTAEIMAKQYEKIYLSLLTEE